MILNHRADWSTCPFCNKAIEPIIWLDHIVRIEPSERKVPVYSVKAYSVCPKCNEESWIHRSGDFIKARMKRKENDKSSNKNNL